MCWNLEVSLGFAAIHFLTFLIVTLLGRKNYRQYQMFTLFYLCMELLQAYQWYYANPGTDLNMSCSDINKMTTVVAYVLIWLQPILFAEIGREGTYKNGSLNSLAFMSYVNFAIAMYTLFDGLMTTQDCVSLENTNYHKYTCTYVGPHHHLLWKFAIGNLGYQPNHYLYLLLILVIFFYYSNKSVRNVLFTGWLGTLALTHFNIGSGPELPAYWCLVTVLVDIPILLDSFLHK